MALMNDIVKHLLWVTLRLLFMIGRMLYWYFTGKYAILKKNYMHSSYYKTVHVQSILARHKLDLVLQPSKEDNFLCVHSSFEDPDYVLKDNISLYYITKDDAIFVETDEGFHVTDSDIGSFVRIAQFRFAKKLIIVPLHVFHMLGEKVGRTDAKIIFLYNTGRCGSTLLTQVFAETGKAVSYSEPDALNAITQLEDVVSAEELNLIAIHTINILCKPLDNRKVECYVLKPTISTMVVFPRLVKLFPNSYNLFMYRDGLQVARSIARTAKETPLCAITLIIGQLSGIFTEKMINTMGLAPDKAVVKILSPIQYSATLWAMTMKNYLDFKQQGYDIVGIRYEDMISDSKYSFHKIFEYVGMEFDGQAVEKAYSQDSQRGSPISMENMSKYKLDEFTPNVKKQTDKVCDSFGLPHFPDKYVAPGTITTKR